MKHKILLIDGSGSMSPHTKEAQSTISSIVKSTPRNDRLKVVVFDSERFEELCNDRAQNISTSIGDCYSAQGATPITDALYKIIQDEVLSAKTTPALNESYKVVVFTDGYENFSFQKTPDELGVALNHFKENFGWEFVFVGPADTGESVRQYAESINIVAQNTKTYKTVADGLKEIKRVINAD